MFLGAQYPLTHDCVYVGIFNFTRAYFVKLWRMKISVFFIWTGNQVIGSVLITARTHYTPLTTDFVLDDLSKRNVERVGEGCSREPHGWRCPGALKADGERGVRCVRRACLAKVTWPGGGVKSADPRFYLYCI